jgi:hypothetical protein
MPIAAHPSFNDGVKWGKPTDKTGVKWGDMGCEWGGMGWVARWGRGGRATRAYRRNPNQPDENGPIWGPGDRRHRVIAQDRKDQTLPLIDTDTTK